MQVKLFLCIIFFMTAAFGQARSDYYILTHPLDYTIYNEYGEPLAGMERNDFVPCTPLRLLAPNFVLGDQITRACKVSLCGRTFFLLKDEHGWFIGEKGGGGRLVVRNCQVIDDTVEVTAGDAVRVTPIAGRARPLSAGVQVTRVFRAEGRYYVKTNGGTPLYGWSTLEPRGAWRRLPAMVAPAAMAATTCASGDTAIPALLKQRIVEKVNSANAAYRQVFARLNGATKGEKSVPQWIVDSSSARLRFVLSLPYADNDELAGSTLELRGEIENLLPGTGYRLTGKEGEMVFERMGKKTRR